MLERLDFWLAVGTLAIFGWIEFNRFVRPIVRGVSRLIRWSVAQRVQAPLPRTGARTGTKTPRLPDTYQAEPAPASTKKDMDDLPELDRSLYRMSDSDEIAVLAVQRKEDGSYRHSANEIAALMHGTRADVLDQIRAIRGAASAVTPSVSPPTHKAQYRPLTSDSRPALD
jgi:hypothetical protein